MNVSRDHYLNLLVSKRGNGLVKVITGIRRCGKSHLLFTLFKGFLRKEGVDAAHIIEVNLDDERQKRLRDPLNSEDRFGLVCRETRSRVMFSLTRSSFAGR